VFWNLGSFGRSALNITITDDLKYHCYVHRTETYEDIADIGAVAD
jgi:hypothetical protein